MPEINRELIGSVELDKTKAGKPVANLYSTDTRLQFPALRLFDLSALLTVGINPEDLGTERIHRRFWAYYAESDKTNAQGNAYKDVQYLEPIDAPATTSSVDTSALLAELRAIRALLEALATAASQAPHPLASNGPDWDAIDQEPVTPDDGPASAIADLLLAGAALEEHQAQTEPPSTPDLDREFGPRNGAPMTGQAMLEILKAQGLPYQSVGHVLYGIRKAAEDDRYEVDWTTKEGQQEALNLARSYGKTL